MYSYKLESGVFGIWENRLNQQAFVATLLGLWSERRNYSAPGYQMEPDITFGWDPSGDRNTSTSMLLSMPYGNQNDTLIGWKGVTGISSQTVRYFATDNQDSVNADAKYYLKIHDRFEQKTYQKLDVFENWRRCSGNIFPGVQGGVEWFMQYSVSGAILAEFDASKFIAAHLGIEVGGSYSWGETRTYSASVPDLASNQYTWLEIGDHYFYHVGTVDKWDEAGYVGVAPFNLREVPKDHLNRYGVRIHKPYATQTTNGGGQGPP